MTTGRWSAKRWVAGPAVNHQVMSASKSKRLYGSAQLQPCPICRTSIPRLPGLPEVHPTCGSQVRELVQISNAALARAGVDVFH